MALNGLELANRALIKLGAAPIQNFDDPVTEANVAKLLYPTLRDSLLSSHPWSFATAQQPLVRLIGRPVADFSYAYQLPNDFLRVLSAGSQQKGQGLTYRILERRLHCDSDHVILSYIFRAKEVNFPPFFDQLMIAKLAAEFCLPIVESVSRAEVLNRFAEEEFRRARQIDAMQDTPTTFQDFSLIQARS